jgi:hypothetical protein
MADPHKARWSDDGRGEHPSGDRMFDRRHNTFISNSLEADCILLRMDELKVTNVDRTAEGVLVTFADGYTFLFRSDFLHRVRLKEGQLVGQEKPDK